MYEYDLNDVINNCTAAQVYVDGKQKELGKDELAALKAVFEKMNVGGYEMPGYGVSIDSLTREELKSGVWVRLMCPERVYRGDIPFESLLIKVDENYCGYNLIREYEGKYQGRVFYFNLQEGKTMRDLYTFLCG